MPKIMSSAEALAIQDEFIALSPDTATTEEVRAALDVVSIGVQQGYDGLFVRFVGRDGRTSDVRFNPAAAMLINGTLGQALSEAGWVDDEGFVTSG
ncbi:hypothetical protein [Paracoccus sp. SSK6]|uniref:hypothetical protein n=1 Tax=Paracoccus sp. SSK6 TaxID=3143131 RepID=UPI003219D37E